MTSMTDRDYLADMAEAIEAAVPDGDYVAPIVAAELVEQLREKDPELLAGWLDLRAAVFLADVIARRSNGRRQAARAHAPRKAFGEAARSFGGSGDPVTLAAFTTEYVVNGENLRRRVADMTGADHQFVAGAYAEQKATAALLEKFHLAVAKKVGVRRTAEVMGEEQYARLYQSITRQSLPAAA
ncbi:hypothetical protein [Streptacidiphilus carbonis]|uniref:hypothetical protein n=1 Tax=Streptacidiphilus carbonis TaxID=105422 RepID=UPI0005AA9DA3|nr:hypothetical protein [Streptacidiphilus carbonis]